MCTCCRSHRTAGGSPCTGPQKGLLKLLNFRRHVGSAAYPIGGAATFENPDCVIGLRAFCVPRSAEWFVTRNALHPCLCREHVPRHLPCRLCRRSDQANARTVNNQKGNEIEVADASSQKNKGQKNSALEMLMSFHGTPSGAHRIVRCSQAIDS